MDKNVTHHKVGEYAREEMYGRYFTRGIYFAKYYVGVGGGENNMIHLHNIYAWKNLLQN